MIRSRKEPAEIGDNSGPTAPQQLRTFLERIERLEEERKALADDIANVYQELAGYGFDKAAAKIVLKIRRADDGLATYTERSQIVDLYLGALDMLPKEGRAPAPARAHGIIEQFDAETGELKSPDPHPPEVDGGQPQPSPDVAPAQKAAAHVSAAAGQDVVIADGQSGHQNSSASQVRNEPESESGEAADHFEPPAFLVKKQTMADYRPLCKHPGNCSSYGLKHCRACLKTEPDVEESEAAA